MTPAGRLSGLSTAEFGGRIRDFPDGRPGFPQFVAGAGVP